MPPCGNVTGEQLEGGARRNHLRGSFIEAGNPRGEHRSGDAQAERARDGRNYDACRIGAARQHGVALPERGGAAALLDDATTAEPDTEDEVVAIHMLWPVPAPARRDERRHQTKPGQIAERRFEAKRLRADRLDVMPDDRAAVDFPVRREALFRRKIARREPQHLGGSRVHGMRSMLAQSIVVGRRGLVRVTGSCRACRPPDAFAARGRASVSVAKLIGPNALLRSMNLWSRLRAPTLNLTYLCRATIHSRQDRFPSRQGAAGPAIRLTRRPSCALAPPHGFEPRPSH